MNGVEVIEPTDGRQFKMTFNALIDFGGSNSYADIRLFNLSKLKFSKGLKIVLKAGYVDTLDTIFIGTVQNVLKERQGADIITRLICRSETVVGFINQSFGANVDVTTLIKACSNALGYPAVIDDSQFADVAPYAGGYALQGDALTTLNKLATTHGFQHSVENGRRVIVRNGFERNTSPFIISQLTGMEGIPQITEVGVDVAMRLSPKIRIGGLIKIESEFKTFNFSNLYFQNVPESAGTGSYRVQRIEHEGDTWGDSWTTRVTGVR